MICERCRKTAPRLLPVEKEGRTLRLCPECVAADPAVDPDACRCKESIGKTPSQLGREMLKDLMFWKK